MEEQAQELDPHKFRSITGVHRRTPAEKGDEILILEKLDGANASIRFLDTGIEYYSRTTKLEEGKATLSGFLPWAQNHVAGLSPQLKEVFTGAIIYGEWMTPHKVKYKDEHTKTFKVFAIKNADTGKYMPYAGVIFWCLLAKLDYAPVLYSGEFTSIEDYEHLVGKSDLTVEPDDGEGIVIYNLTDKRRTITKWVTEKHKEAQIMKKVRNQTPSQAWISQFLTDSRIDKIIYKLADLDELPEKSFDNFPEFATIILPLVYADIMEEEGDTIPEDYDEESAYHLVKKTTPKRIRLYIQPVED